MYTFLPTPKPPIQGRLIILLCMLSSTLLLTAFVLSGKVISIGSQLATAGSLVLPAWFILSDVIAEVYGYEFSKKLFWYSVSCLFIFCCLTELLTYLPSPDDWQGQSSYIFVLGKMLYYYLIGLIALLASGFVNIYAVSKWKILTRGRYFWLRSIGASTLGLLIYSIIASLCTFGIAYLSPLGTPSLTNVINVMATVYIIKIGFIILLAWPASILATLIKKFEGIKTDNYNLNFNPFKS